MSKTYRHNPTQSRSRNNQRNGRQSRQNRNYTSRTKLNVASFDPFYDEYQQDYYNEPYMIEEDNYAQVEPIQNEPIEEPTFSEVNSNVPEVMADVNESVLNEKGETNDNPLPDPSASPINEANSSSDTNHDTKPATNEASDTNSTGIDTTDTHSASNDTDDHTTSYTSSQSISNAKILEGKFGNTTFEKCPININVNVNVYIFNDNDPTKKKIAVEKSVDINADNVSVSVDGASIEADNTDDNVSISDDYAGALVVNDHDNVSFSVSSDESIGDDANSLSPNQEVEKSSSSIAEDEDDYDDEFDRWLDSILQGINEKIDAEIESLLEEELFRSRSSTKNEKEEVPCTACSEEENNKNIIVDKVVEAAVSEVSITSSILKDDENPVENVPKEKESHSAAEDRSLKDVEVSSSDEDDFSDSRFEDVESDTIDVDVELTPEEKTKREYLCDLFGQVYSAQYEARRDESGSEPHPFTNTLYAPRNQWLKTSESVECDSEVSSDHHTKKPSPKETAPNSLAGGLSGSVSISAMPFLFNKYHGVFGEIEVYMDGEGHLYYNAYTALSAIGVSQDVIGKLSERDDVPTLKVVLKDEHGEEYVQTLRFWPVSLILKAALEDTRRARTDMTNFSLKVMYPLMQEILGIRKDFSTRNTDKGKDNPNSPFLQDIEQYLWLSYIYLPTLVYDSKDKVNEFYLSE